MTNMFIDSSYSNFMQVVGKATMLQSETLYSNLSIDELIRFNLLRWSANSSSLRVRSISGLHYLASAKTRTIPGLQAVCGHEIQVYY